MIFRNFKINDFIKPHAKNYLCDLIREKLYYCGFSNKSIHKVYSNESRKQDTIYFSNGRRVHKKKFTQDFKRINTFVRRDLQAFSPHQLISNQKLHQCLYNMQMKPKKAPMTYKMVSSKYNSFMNEEPVTFTYSSDVSDPQKMKIFGLKTHKRRFWSPGVERNHYSSTQNKAIDAIDTMLKSRI